MRTLEYRMLTEAEVQAELSALPKWSVTAGKIERTFAFGNYQDGLVFASMVGYLADQLNHHPDILIGYKKVTVSLSTHDVNGLSPYDFELASRIEDRTL